MTYSVHESSYIDEKVQICVLTYDIRHRKTYDILCLLKAMGYRSVTVYAIPLQYQKSFQPLLQHRPEMVWPIDTDLLCKNFSYTYITINNYMDINEEDGKIILVGGATLLPPEFIQKYQVINSHPGYIPNCRGLDAYKWAIYEKQPIGVTSHLVGNEVDAGEIILREKVSVYENDTFYSLAQRVYENEIRIIVESISCLIRERNREYISGDGYVIHRRMPKDIESKLLEYFERYKSEVVVNGIS